MLSPSFFFQVNLPLSDAFLSDHAALRYFPTLVFRIGVKGRLTTWTSTSINMLFILLLQKLRHLWISYGLNIYNVDSNRISIYWSLKCHDLQTEIKKILILFLFLISAFKI